MCGVLGSDLFFCKFLCKTLQKLDSLIHCHVDLVPNRHQTFGERLVVLDHQAKGYHQIIDVVKNESFLSCVGVLLLEERQRVLTPVSQRV